MLEGGTRVKTHSQTACGTNGCAPESGVGAESTTVATFESSPRVDILETPEGFRVEAELPGVRTEDIDVNLENGILRIEGRVHSHDEGGRCSHVREFGPGAFARSFRLSDTIDAGKISAESKNGLLTLILPKIQATKPRSIPVASAS